MFIQTRNPQFYPYYKFRQTMQYGIEWVFLDFNKKKIESRDYEIFYDTITQ